MELTGRVVLEIVLSTRDVTILKRIQTEQLDHAQRGIQSVVIIRLRDGELDTAEFILSVEGARLHIPDACEIVSVEVADLCWLLCAPTKSYLT